MTQHEFLLSAVAYCKSQGYPLADEPGLFNLLYVEGSDADGRINTDAPDLWNDRRILWDVDEHGEPRLRCNVRCTTEPGLAATQSKHAAELGGVARIMLGWHPKCWQMGWHKNLKWHPALVQAGTVWVHGDLNRDGKRTNDKVRRGKGINQHSTARTFTPKRVGLYSAGCLVGEQFPEHLWWIELLKTDLRYIADPKFLWSTAVLDGSKIPPLTLTV